MQIYRVYGNEDEAKRPVERNTSANIINRNPMEFDEETPCLKIGNVIRSVIIGYP